MSPKAHLAPAGQNPAARTSGGRRVLHIAAALAGSLILVVSLVDPRRGSDQHHAQSETREAGARHE
jgi:hypothetical protein